MRKLAEISNPGSCLNRASDEEMVFVLRGHDIAAPLAIRAWAELRIKMGLNRSTDTQIIEALQCSLTMDRERK